MILHQLLDDQILARRLRETALRDNSKFRMSDAGRCHLMRYWKRQGKPMQPTTDAAGNRAMELGIHLHGLIEDLLEESPAVHVLTEQTLEDDHRIGHYDCLLNTRDDRTILYDFKTISGKQAYWMQTHDQSQEDYRGAKMQHVMQILTYAACLPDPPDELRIAYISRENLAIARDVDIPFEPFERGLVQGDWHRLITAWEQQQEPDANPASWECRYCGYAFQCPHKHL